MVTSEAIRSASPSRAMAKRAARPRLREESGEPAYFVSTNRGKRSGTIDIARAEGQEIVRRVAAQSDVLVENYKAGTLDRYGLGPGPLMVLNPRLIYCSITGF